MSELRCYRCKHFRMCPHCDVCDCNLGNFEGLETSDSNEMAHMQEVSRDCTEYEEDK